MGVDAEMLVKINREVKDEEIKKWSYVFGNAFSNYLILGFDDKIYHKPLERFDNEYHEIVEEIGITWLNVPLSGRYYGPGYERGPLMIYISIAEFLEELIPECEIYYYGDSGGLESKILFDDKQRKEYLRYFIENNGRDKYVRYFDKDNIGPDCPICEVKMVQNGWGQNYKLFSCSGCGWMIREKEGITTNGFNLKF